MVGFTRLFQLIFFQNIRLSDKVCFNKNYLGEGGGKEGDEFYGTLEAQQCLGEFDFRRIFICLCLL